MDSNVCLCFQKIIVGTFCNINYFQQFYLHFKAIMQIIMQPVKIQMDSSILSLIVSLYKG